MKKYYLLLFLLILPIAFAQADIYLDNYSISNTYLKGESISGWMNLSFENEPLNSTLTDSEENEISLKDFLNKTNFNYSCSIMNCLSDFNGSSPQTAKQVILTKDEPKTIGFKFEGYLESINSVEFSLRSDAGTSANNQIKLDITSNDKIETGNTKISSTINNTINYGCFSAKDRQLIETTIDTTPFCQKISIDEAPSLLLGAWIKKVETGQGDIELSLMDENGVGINECTILSSSISTSGSTKFCTIDNLIPEKQDYYVCISKQTGSAKYKTRGYASSKSSEKCGFYGTPPHPDQAAYQIGVKRKHFNPVGTITITDTLSTGNSIAELFEDYIQKKYGSFDCSTIDCYVPIKLIPSMNQTITLSDININYDQEGIPDAKISSVYNLDETPSKISSDFNSISIDNIFEIKTEEGIEDYELEYNGEKLIEEEIEIKDISFSLDPLSTVATLPTEFTISLSPPEEITSYQWDFGDNSTAKTYRNSTEHMYGMEGTYNITVEMKNNESKVITKSFTVTVNPPRDYIELSIDKISKTITKLKSSTSSLSQQEKEIFSNQINLDELEEHLEYIKTKYQRAQTNNEYKEVVSEILSLDYPDSIIINEFNSVPFFIKSKEVYPEDYLSVVDSTGIVSSNEEIENSVLYWDATNLDLTVTPKSVRTRKNSEVSFLFKTFSISIDSQNPPSDYYVFYDTYQLTPIGIENEAQAEEDGYFTIPGNTKRISFVSESDILVTDIPVSIYPPISSLVLEKERPIPEEEPGKGWILAIVLIFIFGAAIGMYFFLHSWYKTKYEEHLFRDKNNLYNLFVFIHSAKKQGLSDEKIEDKLSDSGWTNEQIRYAMRKYEKKETGMPTLIKTSKKEKNLKKPPVPKNPRPKKFIPRRPHPSYKQK